MIVTIACSQAPSPSTPSPITCSLVPGMQADIALGQLVVIFSWPIPASFCHFLITDAPSMIFWGIPLSHTHTHTQWYINYHNQTKPECVHITYCSTDYGRPSKAAAIKREGVEKPHNGGHDHMQVAKLVGVLAAVLSSSYSLHNSISLSLP